jgi:hypothetical protein
VWCIQSAASFDEHLRACAKTTRAAVLLCHRDVLLTLTDTNLFSLIEYTAALLPYICKHATHARSSTALYMGTGSDARFDLVVTNLPQFACDHMAGDGRLASWSAGGTDGRRSVDRFLNGLGRHLASGGLALMTHNVFLDISKTHATLDPLGLQARVAYCASAPLRLHKLVSLSPQVLARFTGQGMHKMGTTGLLTLTLSKSAGSTKTQDGGGSSMNGRYPASRCLKQAVAWAGALVLACKFKGLCCLLAISLSLPCFCAAGQGTGQTPLTPQIPKTTKVKKAVPAPHATQAGVQKNANCDEAADVLSTFKLGQVAPSSYPAAGGQDRFGPKP